MELSKSIELYELIIDRLGNGLAPHQLDAYKDTLEIIKSSSSVEDSMEKIKQSPLYTGVGRALTMDSLLAKQRAMEDATFIKVAQLYADRIEKMNNDSSLDAYDSSFSHQIQTLLQEYFDMIEASEVIIYAYIQLKSATSNDTAMIDTHSNDIRNSLKKINEAGKSFYDLPYEEPYKYVFDAINDIDDFVSDIRKVEMNTSVSEPEDTHEGAEELINFIKENKRAIINAGKSDRWITADYQAIPSDDQEYGYEFSEIKSGGLGWIK